MVNSSEKLPRLLGILLLAGSLAGVLLSFVSVAVLVGLGQGAQSWPLSLHGWWAGDHSALKLTAGLGMLILGATPVVMLLVFGVRAARERRYDTVLVAVGLLGILALGLLMELLEKAF